MVTFWEKVVMNGQQRVMKESALPLNNRKATTGASDVRPEEWHAGAKRLREEQNILLKAAGFVEGGADDLWAKGGVYYGREAALQNIRRE